MTSKMEVYFRIYEEQIKGEEGEDLQYPQLGIHWPNYNILGEKPLWEWKKQIGTIKHQQATLDVSELKVGREKDNIIVSPKMNEAKRYARIVLDKEAARKLAQEILHELGD
jgi:hypothetical protein